MCVPGDGSGGAWTFASWDPPLVRHAIVPLRHPGSPWSGFETAKDSIPLFYLFPFIADDTEKLSKQENEIRKLQQQMDHQKKILKQQAQNLNTQSAHIKR